MSAQAPVLSEAHRKELARAYKLLESSNIATRLADYAGKPLHNALQKAPAPLRNSIERAIRHAVLECLKVAVRSLKQTPKKRRPASRLSAALAGVAGGVGGVFGAAALPLELPVTTILMLRAIADIARHNGEDLTKLEARLACIEVFAYGSDRRADVGYYASRALLGRITSEASSILLQRGASGVTAPAVAALTNEVATRFGVVVWDRIATSAVPIAGAAGAAAINVAFMTHFQAVARGHFALRRLERIYGVEPVRAFYEALAERQRQKKLARQKAEAEYRAAGISRAG